MRPLSCASKVCRTLRPNWPIPNWPTSQLADLPTGRLPTGRRSFKEYQLADSAMCLILLLMTVDVKQHKSSSINKKTVEVEPTDPASPEVSRCSFVWTLQNYPGFYVHLSTSWHSLRRRVGTISPSRITEAGERQLRPRTIASASWESASWTLPTESYLLCTKSVVP